MSYDVFISSAHGDKATADATCAFLEANGIKCWIAPRDITPGQNWGEAIMAGLGQSRLLVLIFSARANESSHVQREVERALNRGMPIIPFRIENVAPARGLDYFLSLPNWLDAFTPPLEPHLRTLVNAVQQLLQLPPTTFAPADVREVSYGPTFLSFMRKHWRLTAAGAAVAALAIGLFAVWPSLLIDSKTDGAVAASAPEIDRMSKAILNDPANDTLYLKRGEAYQTRDMHELAIKDFDEVIRLRPDFARAFIKRSISLSAIGKNRDAVSDCNTALSLATNDADKASALSRRGRAYFNLKEYDLALGDLTHSVEVEPSAFAYVIRGAVHAEKGSMDLAIADETQAIQLAPKDWKALAFRCRYRALANRDLELALDDCDRSLAIEHSKFALAMRGLVNYRLGSNSAAITDLNEALGENPRDSVGLYVRGLAKLRGRDAAGATDIAKAKEIDPQIEARLARHGIAPANSP
jgi:tetratricopeptide (TPR) repeat protein